MSGSSQRRRKRDILFPGWFQPKGKSLTTEAIAKSLNSAEDTSIETALTVEIGNTPLETTDYVSQEGEHIAMLDKAQDTQRTEERYRQASHGLENAIERVGSDKLAWFQFQGELEDMTPAQFIEQVDRAIEVREKQKSLSGWGQCRHVVEHAFTAIWPFAKNFLTIATQGQSVNLAPLFITLIARYQS